MVLAKSTNYTYEAGRLALSHLSLWAGEMCSSLVFSCHARHDAGIHRTKYLISADHRHYLGGKGQQKAAESVRCDAEWIRFLPNIYSITGSFFNTHSSLWCDTRLVCARGRKIMNRNRGIVCLRIYLYSLSHAACDFTHAADRKMNKMMNMDLTSGGVPSSSAHFVSHTSPFYSLPSSLDQNESFHRCKVNL